MSDSGEVGLQIDDSVILNTSSLSTLIQTNCIDILRTLFRHIYVPEAVRNEFSVAFSLPNGIIVRTLMSAQKRQARALGLGRGESEAIVLAKDKQTTLVMDDTPARKVAKRLGVAIIGSVGIVRIAFIKCFIDRADYDRRIASFEQSGRVNQAIISWARSAIKS